MSICRGGGTKLLSYIMLHIVYPFSKIGKKVKGMKTNKDNVYLQGQRLCLQSNFVKGENGYRWNYEEFDINPIQEGMLKMIIDSHPTEQQIRQIIDIGCEQYEKVSSYMFLRFLPEKIKNRLIQIYTRIQILFHVILNGKFLSVRMYEKYPIRFQSH